MTRDQILIAIYDSYETDSFYETMIRHVEFNADGIWTNYKGEKMRIDAMSAQQLFRAITQLEKASVCGARFPANFSAELKNVLIKAKLDSWPKYKQLTTAFMTLFVAGKVRLSDFLIGSPFSDALCVRYV